MLCICLCTLCMLVFFTLKTEQALFQPPQNHIPPSSGENHYFLRGNIAPFENVWSNLKFLFYSWRNWYLRGRGIASRSLSSDPWSQEQAQIPGSSTPHCLKYSCPLSLSPLLFLPHLRAPSNSGPQRSFFLRNSRKYFFYFIFIFDCTGSSRQCGGLL